MSFRRIAPWRARWALLAALLAELVSLPARAGFRVEARVAASADDAEEQESGLVSLAGAALDLVQDPADRGHLVVGLRFPGLAVPRHATVLDAWVQFEADSATSEPTWIALRAEASGDALPFRSSERDLSSRPRTRSVVSWSPPAWSNAGAEGPLQRTPNLAVLLQEVIDRADWVEGNALALIATGGGRRRAVAFDGKAGGAPRLHVEYVRGRGRGRPPDVFLTEPAPLSMFGAGERIAFAATAVDPEDGDLGPRLRWTSDRDGPIGKGARLETTRLSAGVHTITARASDRHGRTDSESVRIEVTRDHHVLVGAGDIAACKPTHLDEATARLLDATFGTVFTLGDNVYEDGTRAGYRDCYEPTWGRHRARTRPAAGNHDYHLPGAPGYFEYFGAAAGDPSRGYYSYDLGDWHVVVLNTECEAVGGCGLDSPQARWLRADLAANPRTCTLAYWHRALFSSSERRWSPLPVPSFWQPWYEAAAETLRPFMPWNRRHSSASVQPFWRILYDAGADVVLGSHEHLYERFAPQDPEGHADPQRGIREFVVGTGGAPLYEFGPPRPNSEVRDERTRGVLELTLRPSSYEWKFVPIEGQGFRDAGADDCVGAVPAISPSATR